MSNQIQTTSIIRDRWQFTIPESLRKTHSWISPGSAVTVINKVDEIVIRPHVSTSKKYDWDKIWEGIKRARAIKGRGGNLSKFIAEDRLHH